MMDEYDDDRRRQLLELAQRQREADLRAVMAQAHGRRVVWGLIDHAAHVFGSSFAGEAPATTAYNEGRRSVGIELMLEVQRAALQDYVLMVSEALRRSQETEPRAVRTVSTRGEKLPVHDEPSRHPDADDDGHHRADER